MQLLHCVVAVVGVASTVPALAEATFLLPYYMRPELALRHQREGSFEPLKVVLHPWTLFLKIL